MKAVKAAASMKAEMGAAHASKLCAASALTVVLPEDYLGIVRGPQPAAGTVTGAFAVSRDPPNPPSWHECRLIRNHAEQSRKKLESS